MTAYNMKYLEGNVSYDTFEFHIFLSDSCCEGHVKCHEGHLIALILGLVLLLENILKTENMAP